jgi:hypothetical protein
MTTGIPEAQGPGTALPDGTVIYGEAAQAPARTFVPPPRPAAERDRDMAAWNARAPCPRCAAIPDDLAAAVTTALRDAEQKGRRGR